MKIVVAKAAGFCMGVRRAVEMAMDTVKTEGEPVYTYGPLIHNPQELKRLDKEGVHPLGEEEDIPSAPVIIRAHGVTPETKRKIESVAEETVDATCPKVSRIQDRIREHSQKGYAIVIAGDEDHPEVAGLLGYADGDAYLIQRPEDVDELPALDKVLLVAQTTQDEDNYGRICKRFSERFPRGKALSTICSSTHKRQEEVRRITGEVEGLVVIGGRNSANTRRLYEIALECGVKSWHIESADELPLDEISALPSVGVTAGASTPLWIIREVVEKLERL